MLNAIALSVNEARAADPLKVLATLTTMTPGARQAGAFGERSSAVTSKRQLALRACSI
jgi:hypothetical protein